MSYRLNTPVCSSRVSLPLDVWYNVAEHLSNVTLNALFSTNSAFFNVAMDRRYHYFAIVTADGSIDKTIQRLEYPQVSRRIKDFTFLAADTLLQSWQYEAALASVIGNLMNVSTYNVYLYLHGNYTAFQALFAVIWKALSPKLERLSVVLWNDTQAKMVAPSHAPLLKHFALKVLWRGSVYPKNRRECIAFMEEFFLLHGRTVTSVDLHLQGQNTKLMLGPLRKIDQITRLQLHDEFAEKMLIEELGQLLKQHRVTLTDLSIHIESIHPAGRDRNAEAEAWRSWARRNIEDPTFLRNLHRLSLDVIPTIPGDTRNLTLECVNRSATTLTSLSLNGGVATLGFLKEEEMEDIVSVLTGPGILKELAVCIEALTPKTFVVLSRLRNLRSLKIDASNIFGTSHPHADTPKELWDHRVQEFIGAMQNESYPNWRLLFLQVNIQGDFTSGKLKSCLRKCFPSLHTLL